MKTTQSKITQEKTTQFPLKEILTNSCIFYTIFALSILFTQFFAQSDLIQPLRFFLLFPFAICVSVANLIFKARSLNTFLKLLIHFSSIAFSFYVCLCTGIPNLKPLVLILILGVAYILVAAPIVTVSSLKKKKEQPKTEYVSMFKESSRSKK